MKKIITISKEIQIELFDYGKKGLKYSMIYQRNNIGAMNCTYKILNNKKFIYIENIYINKGFRKNGYASILLNTLQNDFNNIYLDIIEVGLKSFYEKLNFEMVDKSRMILKY